MRSIPVFPCVLTVLCSLVFLPGCPRTRDEALSLKAFEAYGRGDFKAAAALALSARPSSAAERADLSLLAGKASWFLGELAVAEQSLRKARASNTQLAEVPLFLARLLSEKGEDAEALSLVSGLLSVDPLNVRALTLRSALFLEGGEGGRACADLDLAVEALCSESLALLERARLRWARGDREGTLEDLSKALTLLPPGSCAHAAALRLEAELSPEHAGRSSR